MTKLKRVRTVLLIAAVVLLCTSVFALVTVNAADNTAAETAAQTAEAGSGIDPITAKAIAAAAVVGIVAAAGAIGMALAISKSTESMARQPEAAGKINSAMMLGLVFIETMSIYALVIAILIIFVL